jgi:hypothetical protein
MESIDLRRSLCAGVVSLVVLAAAGCASIGGSGAAEDVALQRAQARWDALVERDWKGAYQYLVPAYRELVPLKRYADQFAGPVRWEGAKAHSAKCEEARCTVKVEISYRMMVPGHADRLSSTFVDEVWVLEGGQWYKFETR